VTANDPLAGDSLHVSNPSNGPVMVAGNLVA